MNNEWSVSRNIIVLFVELISTRKVELEKIASDQSSQEVVVTVTESEKEDANSKNRNKETLGREQSSNEESDQD